MAKRRRKRRKKWLIKHKEVKPKVDKVYKTFMFPNCPELIKAKDLREAQKIHKKLG